MYFLVFSDNSNVLQGVSSQQGVRHVGARVMSSQQGVRPVGSRVRPKLQGIYMVFNQQQSDSLYTQNINLCVNLVIIYHSRKSINSLSSVSFVNHS